MAKFKTANQEKREAYKDEFWPDEIAWTGDTRQAGWFRAPEQFRLFCLCFLVRKLRALTWTRGAFIWNC